MDACRNLEVIAMFERVNNYAQTKNVKIISRRSMDLFYLSAVILRGSLPYVSNTITFVRKNNGIEAIINMKSWPQHFDQIHPSSSPPSFLSLLHP